MSAESGEAARILIDYEKSRWKSQPFERTYALGRENPSEVATLLHLALRELPKGVTFLDAAIAFVPEEALPTLVTAALDQLESGGATDLAEAIIAYVSLQHPAALQPQLERIAQLRPNADTYYADWPWRGSSPHQLEVLRARIEDTSRQRDERIQAWERLLESRDPQALRWAASSAPDLGIVQQYMGSFHEVGMELKDGSLRQIYPDRVLHLVFDEEYRTRRTLPFWLERLHHPTWQLQPPTGAPTCRFGGASDAECAVCGNALHHVITLDPVPEGLGITGLAPLELATCLSCLGWAEPTLFYRHDDTGAPTPCGYEGERREPEFPAQPLLETRVGLAETPARWQWQDWALANGRENLHRLGGHPCWIQSPEYPECPGCGSTMPFLLQLDSDLETVDGTLSWGSGGIGYAFWCDPCHISGFCTQCT